jgi:SHS2 domain-containing protein
MFRYLEHTADVLYEAEAKTLEDLFADAGKALSNTMIELKSVKKVGEYKINLENEKLDVLLHDFLEQILYLTQTELLAFNDFKVKVEEKKEKFFLSAEAFGEMIDKARHEIKADVKAVTWEYFKVWKEKNNWKCKVLLDV